MNDANENLAFVRQVVEDSRRAARIDAAPLLIWSLLTVAASALAYLAPATDTVWLWAGTISAAWLYTGWRVLASRRKDVPAFFAQRALSALWFAALGGMTLTGFGGYFSGTIPSQSLTPLMACFIGTAYLGSSALMQRRGIAILGLLWWLGALILFLTPEVWRMGLFAGFMAAWLSLPVVWLLVHVQRI